MPIAQTLLPEFDHEMATTRSLLERVPDGNGDWKPHERSMTLGRLANHIASLPEYAGITLKQTEMDLNPPDGPKYQLPEFDSAQSRLAAFDSAARSARETIAATPDADMRVMWSLKDGGKTVMSLPRVAVIRSFMMNHLIHHRGQLSVYLRLLDVPLPSIYGPTADTNG